MKPLLRLLTRALREYRLIDDGEHVLVALSGGKDSLCLLQLLAERRHIYPPRFQLSAVHVRMENIAYETDTSYLEDFCRRLDVPLHILTTRFDVDETPTRKQKTPCFLCSWNRGYVVPEDVRAVAHDVLRHRIGLSYEAEASNVTTEDIVSKIINKVEVP